MKKDLHILGKISKTHGYNGTMALVADKPLGDELENLKEVFVVVDGLPVPFPVEEFALLTNTLAHVQLEFAGSLEEARKLVGCRVYTDAPYGKQENEAGLEQWTGFAVRDSKYGDVGLIKKIEDYKGNVVMQIVDGEEETLISMYSGLVTGVDEHAKILYITAPDGYFYFAK